MRFNFIKPTIISCVIGLFVPGITAILLVLLQSLTDNLGIACKTYWNFMWILTSIIAVALPFNFIKNITKTNNPTLSKLIVFNLVEYICLQVCLARLFTNSSVICYGSGGQNGIELIFTAWLSLPILLCLSFVFKHQYNKQNR